jgi:NAD(P)H-dependent FMN reductase
LRTTYSLTSTSHCHRRWASTRTTTRYGGRPRSAALDGFIFVTPEYNHSTSGVLKYAIDYLHRERGTKAAGFASYGAIGGTRAVEHLRLILGELSVADVRQQVAFSLFTDFENFTDFKPAEIHEPMLHTMFDQIIAWSTALTPLHA